MGFVTMATTQRRDGVERGGVIVRDVVIINGEGAAKIAGELKVSNVAAVHSYNYVYHGHNLLEIIQANKKKSGFVNIFFIKLHTQVAGSFQHTNTPYSADQRSRSGCRKVQCLESSLYLVYMQHNPQLLSKSVTLEIS